MCVDYRKLNVITIGDPYPLPHIEELINRIGTSKFITTLDLTKGYYQVPVAPEHKDKGYYQVPVAPEHKDKGYYQVPVAPEHKDKGYYQVPVAPEDKDKGYHQVPVTPEHKDKGYYQVPVAPEHKEKTAFITPYGKYQFTTIPFGLVSAPSTFQILMDEIPVLAVFVSLLLKILSSGGPAYRVAKE